MDANDIERVYHWFPANINTMLPKPIRAYPHDGPERLIWFADDVETLAERLNAKHKTTRQDIAIQESLFTAYNYLSPKESPIIGTPNEFVMLYKILGALIFEPDKQIENPMNGLPIENEKLLRELTPYHKYWKKEKSLTVAQLIKNIVNENMSPTTDADPE